MLYDDLDLRLDDNDERQRWGGASRLPPPAMVASGPENTLSPPAPVASLQRDLHALGFLLAPEPNGVFDLKTEWAVREFQIYAKMDRVAREDTTSQAPEYGDRLSQVPTGAHRYSGPVSGVVNAQTRAALEHWLKESWRCPVVLDAWTTKKGSPPAREMRNIWLHTEGSTDLVVKARDFTGYFQGQAPTDLWAVGKLARYKALLGPQSTIDHAWPDAEVLPETLVGTEWSALSPAQRSTFKVVRAVAEVECYAFFDVVNAYDSAIVSTGIFHFTFQHGTGELCKLLRDLAASYPGDYQRAFGFFGMDVRKPASGKAEFTVHLQDDSGGYQPVTNTPEIDYIRNWHWFYRYVMIGRKVESYRRSMWARAIERIRLIRSAAFKESDVPAVGTGTPATIGHVFTSELAIGYLLRLHVNLPASVQRARGAADGIVDAVKEAKRSRSNLNWSLPPTQWTQDHEDALVDALIAAPKPNAELTRSLPLILSFPNANPRWRMDRTVITGLSRTRDSFQLASAAAPAQPPQPPAPVPPLQPPGPPQPPMGSGPAGP